MSKLKNDIYRINHWEASYKRGENNILYPQTEVIKFLNRHVVKKTSIANKEQKNKKKCLDFACGVGIHSVTCEEFGLKSYGIDISEHAINQAKINAKHKGMNDLAERFQVISSQEQKINFDDNFFDITIAESCLDSMEFKFAKKYFKELKRVSKDIIYFSVISSIDNSNICGDHIVSSDHEKETIQSYFDKDTIMEMTESKISDFLFLKHIIDENLKDKSLNGRYYGALKV